MSLTADKNVTVFDLSYIHRGDAIRFQRAGSDTSRNGIVTKVTEKQLEVLYANVQDTASSFVQIGAADVAAGVWEVWWTTDFRTVNHAPEGDGHPGGGTGV